MDVTLKIDEISKARLKKMPSLMRPELVKGLREGMLMVEARSKDPYLTGKALNVQTGHLRRSVSTSVRSDGDLHIGTIGTHVIYGRFWELGYHGRVTVRRHQRRISQAFGKKIQPKSVTVKQHTRTIDEDARPFMSPAMEDSLGKIKTLLSVRVMEAFK